MKTILPILMIAILSPAAFAEDYTYEEQALLSGTAAVNVTAGITVGHEVYSYSKHSEVVTAEHKFYLERVARAETNRQLAIRMVGPNTKLNAEFIRTQIHLEQLLEKSPDDKLAIKADRLKMSELMEKMEVNGKNYVAVMELDRRLASNRHDLKIFEQDKNIVKFGGHNRTLPRISKMPYVKKAATAVAVAGAVTAGTYMYLSPMDEDGVGEEELNASEPAEATAELK